MILTTSHGDFPIPPAVAQRLPSLPPIPVRGAPDYSRMVEDFERWLEASPQHTVDYERLRRWHLVQEDLAAAAKATGDPFVVTADGLD